MPRAFAKNKPVPGDTTSLKESLKIFMEKVDSGKYQEIIPFYDPGFLSIRVVDEGQLIKMNYQQMIYFWKTISGRVAADSTHRPPIITQKTTVHYVEISGDTGLVLMTRIKDLGHGPEPMFYSLTWIYKNDKWNLLREIVHQRTLPNFR
ncbi:MAG: hypothetical protein ABJB86_08945 [Bacteroidota bacterium]